MNCLTCATACLCLSCLPVGWTPDRADDVTSATRLEARIQQLRKERVDVLTQCWEQMIQQWTYGSIDYEAATDVQQQLLHAELELAQTPAEELAVAEKHAKIAGQTLQTTQAMFSNGRVNEMSLLRAKSEHLQLEMLSAKLRRATSSINVTELDDQTHQLRRQRQEVLRRRCKLTEHMFMQGLCSYGYVCAAAEDLSRAMLDAADSPAAQIEHLEGQLEMAQGLLHLLEAQFEAGRISNLEVLRQKASALRIELERAELRRKVSPQAGLIQKIGKLREELVAVLSQAVDLATAQYNEGAVDVTTAMDSHHQLLRAQLQSSEAPAERQAMLEELLAEARTLAQNAEARYQGGRVALSDVLQARSFALLVEIELLKSRLPEPKANKKADIGAGKQVCVPRACVAPCRHVKWYRCRRRARGCR